MKQEEILNLFLKKFKKPPEKSKILYEYFYVSVKALEYYEEKCKKLKSNYDTEFYNNPFIQDYMLFKTQSFSEFSQNQDFVNYVFDFFSRTTFDVNDNREKFTPIIRKVLKEMSGEAFVLEQAFFQYRYSFCYYNFLKFLCIALKEKLEDKRLDKVREKVFEEFSLYINYLEEVKVFIEKKFDTDQKRADLDLLLDSYFKEVA